MKSFDSYWRSPFPDLMLSGDAVHAWRVFLDQPAEYVRNLARTLSYDELARAERFRFERDRRRFVVGRGVLRAILGQYLDIDPGQIRFSYGERGKPYLAEGCGSFTLRFNLAHSHELALYAFAHDREIGIDIEYTRPLSDAEEIAARFFSARENATFCSLPKNQELEAFYNCWTRKEAYLKAIGDGLSRPLNQFDVSLAPGDPAELLHVEGYPLEITRWSLRTFVPDSGYVATIAVEGRNWHLVHLEWPVKQ